MAAARPPRVSVSPAALWPSGSAGICSAQDGKRRMPVPECSRYAAKMNPPKHQGHQGVVTSSTARWSASNNRTMTGVLILGAAVLAVGASACAHWWVAAGLGIAVVAGGVTGYVVAAPNIRVVPGMSGYAEVIGKSSKPFTKTMHAQCELLLKVHVSGGDGVRVRIKETVPWDKWPRVRATLPVLVAVDDPGNVRVRWELIQREPDPAAEPTWMGDQYGTVKWFNVEKGFGYIEPNNGGPEVFVHHSAIAAYPRTLTDCDRVWFCIVEDKQGRRSAENVRKA